jgi:hypothetical protein
MDAILFKALILVSTKFNLKTLIMFSSVETARHRRSWRSCTQFIERRWSEILPNMMSFTKRQRRRLKLFWHSSLGMKGWGMSCENYVRRSSLISEAHLMLCVVKGMGTEYHDLAGKIGQGVLCVCGKQGNASSPRSRKQR